MFTFVSCESRKIVYAGFNDLVAGSQSFILYNDNTFYLQMGAGGIEGKYQISHDTVQLNYFNKPSVKSPVAMLIRRDHFISLDNVKNTKHLKILRTK